MPVLGLAEMEVTFPTAALRALFFVSVASEVLVTRQRSGSG